MAQFFVSFPFCTLPGEVQLVAASPALEPSQDGPRQRARLHGHSFASVFVHCLTELYFIFHKCRTRENSQRALCDRWKIVSCHSGHLCSLKE